MKPRKWPEGFLFIKTELELGSTFAKAALGSKTRVRIIRNTANARAAYDSASKHVGQLSLSSENSGILGGLFIRLRLQLLRLGESV
ncbi:MAG TPA: hypothetical protein VFU50_03035 [Terriglobales bacterium]|nr:hypothetical protein [Terriglobales bacterium]